MRLLYRYESTHFNPLSINTESRRQFPSVMSDVHGNKCKKSSNSKFIPGHGQETMPEQGKDLG